MKTSHVLILMYVLLALSVPAFAEPPTWVSDGFYTSNVIITSSLTALTPTPKVLVSANTSTREVYLYNNSPYTIYLASATAHSNATWGYPMKTLTEKIYKTQSTIYGIGSGTATISVIQLR